MAISIDYATRIIYIPKDFTSLVQTTPYEIRELNIDTLRIALKDLEDDEEGMVLPDTHRHNTTVTVSGTVLARVVEFINGFTITLEDGQYAVKIVGGNSNLADVLNLNQVSTRSGNTAGLIEVASGGSSDAEKIVDIWRILGLDVANPQIITDTSITVGSITVSISQDDQAGTTTVARQ